MPGRFAQPSQLARRQVCLKLLEEADRRKVVVDVFAFNMAISACVKGGHWERAPERLDEMERKGIRANEFTYSVISTCGKGGQWERALKLLQEMERKGLKPDAHTFSSAISACGNAQAVGAVAGAARLDGAQWDSGQFCQR